MLKQPTRRPPLLRMRSKLASTTGRALYRRRKARAEPVIGILKEQRGMRRFRMRGLGKVAAEFALATTALNLTRMWRLSPPCKYTAQQKSKPHRATTPLESKCITQITKNSPTPKNSHPTQSTDP